jgi:hypothetical protein
MIGLQSRTGSQRGELDEQFRAYLQKSKAMLEPAIEAELRRALGRVTSGDGALIESLNQGKKLRGCLTCLVGQALGAALDLTVPRAVAVEMLQAASLVHDDYVDQDCVRRDRPAVWTTEGGRRAVLIGDVTFAWAIEMMCRLSREDCSAVSRAVAMISLGALREPLGPAGLAEIIGNEQMDGKVYKEIIRLKTGVLFGTACELGAIAAGAEDHIRRAAHNYGLRIGQAYQIADDLKEVAHHLGSRHIEPEQMMPLAPAFLCFEPNMRPNILQCLRDAVTEINDDTLRLMTRAGRSMNSAIEGLLRSAVAEMEGALPSGPMKALALGAPWITIDMFNESW